MAVGTGGSRSKPRRAAPGPPSGDFEHLSLEALRTYREALAAEENRVSYWRRLIQSRLDVVRAGASGAVAIADLQSILCRTAPSSFRGGLVRMLPVADFPPTPNIATLWDTQAADGDPEREEALAAKLAAVEAELSVYRRALHDQIGAATTELIARYRVNPVQCLTALPERRVAVRSDS